jgi:cytochrome c553
MNKKLLAGAIFAALAGAPAVSLAEGGSINAGKEKSAVCAGCHGEDGNSSAPLFPKLAGQHPHYFVKQLQAFKDGSRNDATMASMAANLSQQDMIDIALYFAANKVSANDMPELEEDEETAPEKPDAQTLKAKQAEKLNALLAKGSDLYRNGNLASEVSACIACHGPRGEGNKPAGFPALKGQHAAYLIKTLNDFKTGVRANNPENIMHMIAKKMTDEEIKAVAYHVSIIKD